MKKSFLFIIISILLGCGSDKKYEVCYKVHYPDYTKTYTVIIDDVPYLGSDRGTNFLKESGVTGTTIAQTSAPIEVVYYKRLDTGGK